MSKLKQSMTSSGNAKNTSELRKMLDALTFIAASASVGPVDYFNDPSAIKTDIVLGKKAKNPLKLGAPILIAAMSTGALSKPAKEALAKGSAIYSIPHNTGEGGILNEERKNAKILIAQYSTGRFGWPKRENFKAGEKGDKGFDKANSKHVKGCAAIEIKFGQGAKPGQGGLLLAKKITPLISNLRDIDQNKDCHSPAFHPDIKNSKDLKNKIDWLRKISNGLPIMVKFGAGHIEKDINFAIEGGADIIAMDGAQGGTGAAPTVMLNEVGVDTISTIVRMRRYYGKLEREGMKSEDLPDFIIGGGLTNGADIAKALALGARAVFMGFPFMKALGCTGCKECWKGTCRMGIATQDPQYTKNLDVDKAATGVEKFVNNCITDMKMIAAACGKNHVSLLDKKVDLLCCNTPYGELGSKICNIPMSWETPPEFK